MSFKKVSMVFFIIGVLVSVFSGAFDVLEGLENTRLLLLVTLGVIVGLLNISKDEQMSFLLSSVAFLFSASILINVSPLGMRVLQGIFLMLYNLMVFIAPATLVISLKLVFEFASESKKDVVFEVPKHNERPHHENMWDIVVFVSVAFVIVVLILESFFNLEPYPDLVAILAFFDYLVLAVFVVDLFVLYNKQKNIKLFFTKNWLDIVAVIPFGTVFRLTKLVRLVRIVKIFTRAQKATRVNRATKFFSDESGFNKLISPDDNQPVPEQKVKKATSKKKSSKKPKKKK